MKLEKYIGYNDGTHAHVSYSGERMYCSKSHKKPISPAIKYLIVSGWLVAVIAIAHLILKSNGL
jgi:hypothetical protein